MLLLNRDSHAWKTEVYNHKGHQFVYFIRNHDSKTAKVGLHNRDIYALWQRYKTYYANFDAYIVRVEDSKHVEKRLFQAYDERKLRVANEMVVNNDKAREIFKYVTSHYDLDYHGSKTVNTAKLVNNYHDSKSNPKVYEKHPHKTNGVKKPAEYKYYKPGDVVGGNTKMYVSDKLNDVKDSIRDFFGFY